MVKRKRAVMRSSVIELTQIAGVLAVIVSLILYSSETIEAAKNGMLICVNAIIPSLFPFFVLSTIIVESGMVRRLGRFFERVMKPLFNVGGECAAAFALGFVGGYPIGAKTVISLYENKACTKTEAERMLSFCNNSGPAFIFGVVGAGVFASGKIGLLLYVAHTAASILVGMMFRFYKRGAAVVSRCPSPASGQVKGPSPASITPVKGPSPVSFSRVFANAVKSASGTTVNICGFVIFFTVFTKMLFLSGALPAASRALEAMLRPFGMTDSWAEKLLTGFIELSAGVYSLRDAGTAMTGSVAMAAFMLGWAGLSVHSQVLSFIGESGLSIKTYISGKMIQAVISTGFIFLISKFSSKSVTASALLATQITSFAEITFMKAAIISLLSAFGIFLFLLGIVWIAAARDMKR